MIQLTTNHTAPRVLARKQIASAIPAEEMGILRALKIFRRPFIGSHACKPKV